MSTMPTGVPAPVAASPLGDPELRRFIEDFVRRRVPPSDAEDVVQTVLCDALAAERVPTEREELRKWLVGIARHKVADFHRKGSRERPTDPPEQEVPPAPVEVREMARWAEEQAMSTRDGAKTLDWMAREGEGEKLENIAAEENVPAARVRQRVSRMRRWMKERWAAEVAAVALLALLAVAVWRWLRPEERPEALPEQPPVAPSPEAPTPLDRARALRAEAIVKCEASEWQACLDGLDEAKRLDPIGDAAPEVVDARSRAADALAPPPVDPESTSSPTSKTAPPIAPKQQFKPKAPDKKKLEEEMLDQKLQSPPPQNAIPSEKDQKQQLPPPQLQQKTPAPKTTKPLGTSSSSSIDFGGGTGSTSQSTLPTKGGKK